MTMLALSLATGIVIDDAIVVLENIFRFVEEKGVTPKEAAAEATAEIGLAVMATTLSLVVIFVPVAFMTGQIGRYFYSFGITSAAAILISMFVSFTLTPALCAMWLRTEDVEGRSLDDQDRRRSTRGSIGVYGRMLEWSLHHRAGDDGHRRRRRRCRRRSCIRTSARSWCPTTTRASSASTCGCRAARATSAPRSSSSRSRRKSSRCRRCTASMQNVEPGSANFNIMMTPLEERNISQQELMIRRAQMLRKYQGARISVSGGTDISGASSGGGGGGRGGGGGGGGGGSTA